MSRMLRFRFVCSRAVAWIILSLALVVFAGGCQASRSPIARKLVAHQAQVDLTGLSSVEAIDSCNVVGSTPRQWIPVKVQKSALYTHSQWKSANGRTGMGVAYIRMPLPLGERAILWFAKQQYSRKREDGRLIAEWVDPLGRHWFEAENERYHVRGYAICRGFGAWVVYYGHKRAFPPESADIALAARAAETMVPQPLVGKTGWPPVPPPAIATVPAQEPP